MISKQECANGIRIVHEHMPYSRSVAMGIWVEAGSADEQGAEAGIAHFIEHMLFKGTASRTARTIAEQFDRMGGDLNAFTSKEMTCFHATVLKEHAEKALTIMEDMVFHSVFDPKEMAKEKSVVIEEIATVEDSPDDDVHELLWQAMYPDDPIGKPILGSAETIEFFGKKAIVNYMKRLYRPERIVISIAGNYDNALISFIEEKFGTIQEMEKEEKGPELRLPQFQGQYRVKKKDIEQTHLCIGFPGLPIDAERIYEVAVLDSVLGGSMSSRLFQEVRETRGLAYSIYSYHASYKQAGAFAIYGGTSPEKTEELYETIQDVICSLRRGEVSAQEVENAKAQVKGEFLLGLESVESRMYRNGKNELLLRDHKSIDEIVSRLDSVERSSVQQIAADVLGQKFARSIITCDQPAAFLDFDE